MSQLPNDDIGTKDLVSRRDIILESDSDQDGVGDIVLRTGGVERARINASGVGTGWSNVLGGSLPATTITPVAHSSYGLTMQDDSARTFYKIGNGGADAASIAASVLLYGTNGTGPGLEAWNFGVDVAASTPYRDFFLSKVLSGGGVSDADGIYISAGAGDSVPASVGMGLAQPPVGYRLHVQPSTLDPTQGGLVILTPASQTGKPFAVLTGNSEGVSSSALEVKSDFSTRIQANPSNRTVTDGVLNSTTTVTSATAAFTTADLGRFITGTGIPTGTYISAVGSATSITLSAAATATASGVSLTVVANHFSVHPNSHVPFISANIGSGSGAVVCSAPLFGIGPGAPSTPTANLDIVSISTNAATLKVRSQATGNAIVITANGSGSATSIGPNAASSMALQTNNTARLTLGASGGFTVADANDFTFGTTTGSKIGTTTTGKLGFFNTTPVVQPTGTPAAATDLASVISLANSLRTNLLALGLVA